MIGAVGVVYAGEEVIILGKGKTQALAEWDKPVHFGTVNWKVMDDAENQAIKLRAEASSFSQHTKSVAEVFWRTISFTSE